MTSNDRTQKNKLNLTYHAFLVRLWRDTPTSPWRAMIQHPGSSERRHFSDIVQLLTFLLSLTEQESQSSQSKSNQEV